MRLKWKYSTKWATTNKHPYPKFSFYIKNLEIIIDKKSLPSKKLLIIY